MAEVASKKLLVPQFHSAFGLKFLIESFSSLSLNDTVNSDLLKALCMINYQQPIELLPEPHEEDDNYEVRLAEVHHKNDEAKKKNEKLLKLQSRCRIEVVESETNYAKYEEKCLIMLNNYRELVSSADGHTDQATTLEKDKTMQNTISATSRRDLKMESIEK
jgi:hypothetical protein